MSSIIKGYNYDIFISYRQKDNKGDRWVSEFVDALKTELEATFKEDISVYFDENPHGRLQETHNVDKSLEGKLKCPIFIPILSQTYCDPNSYAWQNEFLAFLRMVENDPLGKDIKLRDGNVASRILPIRIHDLEQEDVKLFEKETGSVLRAMDFVFKTSTGVNRPLKANEDHPQDNLNKIFYADQINKVAHAIKEIILGMKTEPIELGKDLIQHDETLKEVMKEGIRITQAQPAKLNIRKVLSRGIVIAVLIILALLAFPKVFQRGKNKVAKDPDGKISIAVTNFDNNTNDTTLNWLTKGIPELIRNNLIGSGELLVQNSQTMYELYESMGQTQNASVEPFSSREAAAKLKTGTYITGSFQKFGNNILTYVKLTDTKSDELLWTGNIEGNLDKYKYLADSLSARLKDFLEIKVIKQKASEEYSDVNTNSPDALKKYVEGMELMISGNTKSAAQSFGESYMFDTTFTLAAVYTAYAYSYSVDFISAVKWTKIAYRGIERLPYDYKQWMESWKAAYITKNCDSVLYYINLLAQSGIKSRLFWFDIGYDYWMFDLNKEAIKAFEKAEMISSEWGGDWKIADYYAIYGRACHNAGLHEKEAKIYETGLRLFPDNMGILSRQVICATATGDTLKAAELITKVIKQAKEQGASASDIETGYGNLYVEVNSFKKAEEHFRHALELMPHETDNIYRLADFLIENEINIPEGMALIDSLLIVSPENENYLKSKGVGYFKQGKYKEALALLEKSYDKSIVWDTRTFNYIKKCKAAITNQKTN